MCNYFSVGIESRIGLGFDKSRTGSACCNKFWYGWEGLKKMCCCRGNKTKRIKETIKYVATVDPETGAEKILFASDQTIDSENYIKGDPVSFVCTNINSFMGGRANLWESGKNKDLGLIDSLGRGKTRASLKIKDQAAHDDDHLEFHTVQNTVLLALGKSQTVS